MRVRLAWALATVLRADDVPGAEAEVAQPQAEVAQPQAEATVQTDRYVVAPLLDTAVVCTLKCSSPCHRLEHPDIVECRVRDKVFPLHSGSSVTSLRVTDVGDAHFVVCYEHGVIHCHAGDQEKMHERGVAEVPNAKGLISMMAGSLQRVIVCYGATAAAMECVEADAIEGLPSFEVVMGPSAELPQ
jgi:hypothetical protein